jgi:hypothetical protein
MVILAAQLAGEQIVYAKTAGEASFGDVPEMPPRLEASKTQEASILPKMQEPLLG